MLIPHSDEVQLEDAVVSKDFVAVFTRRGGLQVASPNRHLALMPHTTHQRLHGFGSCTDSAAQDVNISSDW